MHFSTLVAALAALLFAVGALVYQAPQAYVIPVEYLAAHGFY